ncbi:adenylate/guanylate cyclase domain-containing protein [Aliikangiella sp. IMCC44653]
MKKQEIPQAILFADVCGSSALYKQLGNIKAKLIIDELLNSIQTTVTGFKGRVVKTIGDEVMASFATADDSFTAAIDIQKANQNLLQNHHLKVAVGIGFGQVLSEQSDLFGDAVNDAACVTRMAKGEQVLLTEEVFNALSLAHKASTREFDQVVLKGATAATMIYRAFWQYKEYANNETQMFANQDMQLLDNCEQLVINYRDQSHIIGPLDVPYVIGRDANQCDLLVEGSQVSREHCQIKYNRGKFVLVDSSTNGCYLLSEANTEVYIRREEYPLIGNIRLSLGLPLADAELDIIECYYN